MASAYIATASTSSATAPASVGSVGASCRDAQYTTPASAMIETIVPP